MQSCATYFGISLCLLVWCEGENPAFYVVVLDRPFATIIRLVPRLARAIGICYMYTCSIILGKLEEITFPSTFSDALGTSLRLTAYVQR